jgi:hypothetical protein
MRRITFLLVAAVVTVAGVVGFRATASRHAGQAAAPKRVVQNFINPIRADILALDYEF